MCSTKVFLAMIFNEIKGHVNTSLCLVGGMRPYIPPLCSRLVPCGPLPIKWCTSIKQHVHKS